MTGTKRLRNLAGAWDEWGLGGTLAQIADQIERERACDEDAIENVRLIVGGVVDDMERHVSGVEGMEDSPVARWARELREAMRGEEHDPADDVSVSPYDLLPKDDRDAVAWVREHGGLDEVEAHWPGRVPLASVKRMVALHKKKRERLKAHALWLERKCAERRDKIIELNKQIAQMRPRLMPEGYEWPRFESGDPVMLGDSVVKYVGGGEFEVRSIEFRDGAAYLREGFRTEGIVIVRPGERVKRPAVPAADGKPLREGETVYDKDTGDRFEVDGFSDGYVMCTDIDACESDLEILPSQLTHERPIADTWERLEEDTRNIRTAILDSDKLPFEVIDERALDLVRRAKKLAGVSE